MLCCPVSPARIWLGLYLSFSLQVVHSRPAINVSEPDTKERIGLDSWADPGKARTRAANLRFFSPFSNVWNKIQMNQLFQGQSFNYIPAFSADKNVNSPLAPVVTAMLPPSAAQRGPRPLCPGDHHSTAGSFAASRSFSVQEAKSPS